MPWPSVMAPPHSSGIWKVKVDAVAGTVVCRACPQHGDAWDASRGETADTGEVAAPSDHREVKKYGSPRGSGHFSTAIKEFLTYGRQAECSFNSLKSQVCIEG